MPRIACLGWGSLVWNEGNLPIRDEWHNDGPLVKVEFLRRSSNGCITLVLDESAAPVPSLWTLLDVENTLAAAVALQDRERTLPKYLQRHIGVWEVGKKTPSLLNDLPAWAQNKEIDAVVWTNLPRKFHRSGDCATADEIVAYLKTLVGATRKMAEEYVRKAPAQIVTAYRTAIEETLGWMPWV